MAGSTQYNQWIFDDLFATVLDHLLTEVVPQFASAPQHSQIVAKLDTYLAKRGEKQRLSVSSGSSVDPTPPLPATHLSSSISSPSSYSKAESVDAMFSHSSSSAFRSLPKTQFVTSSDESESASSVVPRSSASESSVRATKRSNAEISENASSSDLTERMQNLVFSSDSPPTKKARYLTPSSGESEGNLSREDEMDALSEETEAKLSGSDSTSSSAKPYVCIIPSCGASFTRKHNLKVFLWFYSPYSRCFPRVTVTTFRST